MNNKIEVRKMIATTSLLAVAIVFDLLVGLTGLRMPFGGNFLGISMIPLVLIGLFFGLKYGLIAGFLYALYNFGVDYIVYLDALRLTLESWTGESWSAFKIVLLVGFDYIIPFMAFGLSGLFSEAFQKKSKFILSFIVVSIIRLISSTISGVIFWGSSIQYAVGQVDAGLEEANIATKIFAFVGNDLWLYSLGYNFIYIFTTFVASILIGLVTYKRMKMLKEDYFSI